jgi:hypothetical protein
MMIFINPAPTLGLEQPLVNDQTFVKEVNELNPKDVLDMIGASELRGRRNEGISNNHGEYLWFNHAGTYLARSGRGWPNGEGPVFCGAHNSGRGVERLGLAVAQPVVAFMSKQAGSLAIQQAGSRRYKAADVTR